MNITTTALAAALEAAGTAQALADSKIRTFSQTSAPTGMTAADVGDLWIDTDDSNKMYRWNGSAWVAVQDTHLDDTVAQVQTDLSLVPGQILAAVTQQQIGAVNRLLNSDFSDNTFSPWVLPSNYGLDSTRLIDGKPSMRITCAAADNYAALTQYIYNLAVPVDTSYTLSFWLLTYSTTRNIQGSNAIAVINAYDANDVYMGGKTIPLSDYPYSSFRRASTTYIVPATTTRIRIQFRVYALSNGSTDTTAYIAEPKFEVGDKATDWSPAVTDPASGVKTSYIKILADLIEIASGGTVDIKAGSVFNLRSGSASSSIGISNNVSGDWFLWAGAADPGSAPYRVKRDGSVWATLLSLGNSQITDVTNTYAQHFWENADSSYPAIFAIYVPENTGSVASVKLSFKAQKYRAWSKSASSGGGSTSGAAGTLQTNNTTVSTLGTPHNHTVPDHTHSTPNHTHGITYGIYEKSTLPTSCTLKVDGNTVATYTNTPPSVSELEISSYLSKTGGIINKGWHEIEISTNNDVRIVANVFVQTVVSSVTGTM